MRTYIGFFFGPLSGYGFFFFFFEGCGLVILFLNKYYFQLMYLALPNFQGPEKFKVLHFIVGPIKY